MSSRRWWMRCGGRPVTALNLHHLQQPPRGNVVVAPLTTSAAVIVNDPQPSEAMAGPVTGAMISV